MKPCIGNSTERLSELRTTQLEVRGEEDSGVGKPAEEKDLRNAHAIQMGSKGEIKEPCR